MTAFVRGSGTETTARRGFTIAADGSYAACLAAARDGCWYPERWTLAGPEPYTVPLPGNQPEEPDAQVLPLPDGRVLIRRRVADRHDLSLLYPAGPGTGQAPVGFLYGEEVRLLPPATCGCAFALSYVNGTTAIWLVHEGTGPQRIASVEGHCTGGVWLDREGCLLALDREAEGRIKTVAVDLATGTSSPLLQITEDSEDRLLLADPDSGLLLVRSDAPGTPRLGWGVLGSVRPVRFPDCLRSAGEQVVPVAAQPGQQLMPESCGVALRDGDRLALWRPAARQAEELPTPEGWLAGSAWWSPEGVLRLPYATASEQYGVLDVLPPGPEAEAETQPEPEAAITGTGARATPQGGTAPAPGIATPPRPDHPGLDDPGPDPGLNDSAVAGNQPPAGRVLPLQQAPLALTPTTPAPKGAWLTDLAPRYDDAGAAQPMTSDGSAERGMSVSPAPTCKR